MTLQAARQREEILRTLATGTSDVAFLDLLDPLVASCPPREAKRRLTDPHDRQELRDLVLAGELVVERPGFDHDHPLARRIFAEATRHIDFYHAEDYEAWALASRCRQLLARTVHLDAARRALAFISSCASVPDLGYPIDDARVAAKHESMRIVCHAGRLHAAEIEEELIRWVGESASSINERCADAFALMADLGTRRSFECMRTFIASRAADHYLSPYLWTPFWQRTFEWIARHEFAPDLVRALNDTASGQRGRPGIMAAYHEQLRCYASTFEGCAGQRLYDRLEPGGVQFWDYWMTYAPEAVRSP